MVESGLQELIEEFRENGSKKSSEFSVEERRQGYEESSILAGEAVEIDEVKDDIIEGVKVRFYNDQSEADSPIIIYFHGGCFISGGFKTHDKQMRLLAQKCKAKVCLIDYRLAPEYKFPAAHDDCIKVVSKIAQTETQSLILMGDSAGGNIALSIGLSLKENRKIKKIVLIYPMLDPYGEFSSIKENGNDYIMTSDAFSSGY
ncbi:MAG: alpha/beta hydrolase fold domain-containing protein, partial [Spirochaetales bacterium]|nr:alpha/beta hydrolase fold domain-containing protein [Spirochaetales bacterium]